MSDTSMTEEKADEVIAPDSASPGMSSDTYEIKHVFKQQPASRLTTMHALAAVVTKMDVWMWVGPDERRLWTSAWGGRGCAAVLACWRWTIGLCFLGFQIWSWRSSDDPSFYLAYLTEQTMWLSLSYYIIAASTGTAVLAASYKGLPYSTGVPPALAGSAHLLMDIPTWHRWLWMHTLRAQQLLFGIMCVGGEPVSCRRALYAPLLSIAFYACYCSVVWELVVVFMYWVLLFDGVPAKDNARIYLFAQVCGGRGLPL
jgi:hypothetical protein